MGTGDAQVDLLRFLSEHHTVHAVSYDSVGRAKVFTDYFELIDIKDKQAVLNYSREREIDLVYSIGSDLGMVTSAWVSHELDLPTFITPETAITCNVKSMLRKQLGNLTGNIPYQILKKPDDIGDFGFPCIIKPVDSQGQRGVFLVKDRNELLHRFPRSMAFSRRKTVIAEKYIEGPEISVNVYLVDGKIRFAMISDRIVWPEYPGGIIHKHRIPSQYSSGESKAKIQHLISEVIDVLGIRNGPVYFQIKMDQKYPKLIEVTPRLDGCHLWRLIKYATDVDLLETTLTHLQGDTATQLEKTSTNGNWTLEFMCEKPSTILNKDKFNLNSSVYHEWYYEDGEMVMPTNTYMEKCGYKIYQA